MDIENIYSICRLCLSDSPVLSILDCDYSTLQQKILTLVNVEVRDTDKVTKMICNQCYMKIEELFDFKKNCEQSQFKLQCWVTNNTPPSDSPPPLTSAIKLEPMDEEEAMDIAENENEFQIKTEPEDCYTSLDSEYLEAPQLSPQYPYIQEDESLLVPLGECSVATHGIEFPRDTCRICHKKFFSSNNRIRHEQTVHNYNENDETIDIFESMPVLQEPINEFKTQVIAVKRIEVKDKESHSFIHTEVDFINYFTSMRKMLDNFKCSCCNNNYGTKKKLLSHLRKTMNVESYCCYYCWIIFPNFSQFMHHSNRFKQKKACYAREKMILSGSLENKVYQNYICTLCQFLLIDETGIREHMESKHTTSVLPITCTTCDCILETEEDFKEHLHNSCFFRIYCGICRNHFPNLTDFDNHCTIHSDNFEGINDDTMLINPAKLISPPKLLHNCHLCKNKYNNNLSLFKHLKVYHNDPNISICKLCPDNALKKFMVNNDLTEHMQTCHNNSLAAQVTQENNFSCNICNALFGTLNEWKSHQSVHVKKFACSDCSAVFETSHELESHKRNHSDLKLKLYRCSENSYVTSQQASNTDILMCRICDKFFNSKKQLHDHLALHETMPRLEFQESESEVETKTVKTYDCHLCNKSYKFKFSLKKHNRNVHGEEKSDSRVRSKSQPPENRIFTPGNDGLERHCTICNLVVTSSAAFDRHNNKYHSNLTKSKIKMKKERNSMPNLVPETEDYKDVKKLTFIPKTVECKICGNFFASEISLRNHSRVHNKEPRALKKVKIEKEDPDVQRSSRGRLIKKNPAAFHANGSIRCPICNKIHSDVESLQEHILTHVTDDMVPPHAKKLYPCIHCGKICLAAPSLVNHIRYMHDQAAIKRDRKKCRNCKSILTNNAALANHLRVCTKESPTKKKIVKHTCTICHKIFGSFHALQGHVKNHVLKPTKDVPLPNNNNKNVKKKEKKTIKQEFSCTKCNLQFSDPELLQKHLQIHISPKKKSNNVLQNGANPTNIRTPKDATNENSFQCTICNTSYSNAASFISHKGWHKRQHVRQSLPSKLTHNCSHCNKSFADQLTYQQHQVKHGLRYSCNHCDKTFTYPGSMKKHLEKTHEDSRDVSKEVPHEVVENGLPAVQEPPKPKKTEKKNKSPPNYKCTECNLLFPNSKKLRLHVTKHANTTV